MIKNCAKRILEVEKEEKHKRFVRDFAMMHNNIRSDMFHLALENLKSSYVDIHGALDRNNAIYILGQLLSLAGVTCHFYDRVYLIHVRMNVEYHGSLKGCTAPKVAPLEFAREKHVVVVHDADIVEKLTSGRINFDISVRASRDGHYCAIF